MLSLSGDKFPIVANSRQFRNYSLESLFFLWYDKACVAGRLFSCGDGSFN
ncbi:MAG: hypothetical protein LBK25_00225 [Treponema sp.]|nr:hypothetical protein [Treponema sp.]